MNEKQVALKILHSMQETLQDQIKNSLEVGNKKRYKRLKNLKATEFLSLMIEKCTKV